tara:strand:+ start:2413 stop:5382 length:2970 start_codon:yes stop_codon:yes gene_type:complete
MQLVPLNRAAVSRIDRPNSSNESDMLSKQQNSKTIFLIFCTKLLLPILVKEAEKGTLINPLKSDASADYEKLRDEINWEDPQLFKNNYKRMYDYLKTHNLTEYRYSPHIKKTLLAQIFAIAELITRTHQNALPIEYRFPSTSIREPKPNHIYKQHELLIESLRLVFKDFDDFHFQNSKFLSNANNTNKSIIKTINDLKQNLSISYPTQTTHNTFPIPPSRSITLLGLLTMVILYKSLPGKYKFIALPLIFISSIIISQQFNRYQAKFNLRDKIMDLSTHFNELSEKTQDNLLHKIPLFTTGLLSLKPSYFYPNLFKDDDTFMGDRRRHTVEYVVRNMGLYLPPSANEVPDHVSRIWHPILMLNCYLDDAADGCLPKDLKAQGYKLSQQYAKDAAFMCFFFILNTLKSSEFQNFIDDVKSKIKYSFFTQTIPCETLSISTVSETLIDTLTQQAPQFSFSLSLFPWFKYNFHLCMIDYLSGCRLDTAKPLCYKLDNFKSLRKHYTNFLNNLNQFNQPTIVEANSKNSLELAQLLLSSKPTFKNLFKYLGANKDTFSTSYKDTFSTSYRLMNFLMTSHVFALTTESNQSLSVLQIQQLTLSHVYDSHQMIDKNFIDSNATTPMLQASFLSYFFKNILDSIVKLYDQQLAHLSINLPPDKQPPPSVTHTCLPNRKVENFIKNFLNLLTKNKDLFNKQPTEESLTLNYFIKNFLSIQKINELVYIGNDFYRHFNDDKINSIRLNLTNIVKRNPHLLNSLIELYIFFEQIGSTQLLAKYANDIDCFGEITGHEFTLTPVSYALLGFSTPEQFQKLLRNLLELDGATEISKDSLLEYLTKAEYQYLTDAHRYFLTQIQDIPHRKKAQNIEKNLRHIEKNFRDIIGEFKQKLIDHYTAQDFFSLYLYETQKIQKPQITPNVIHSIVNNLTKILDMYIKRLKHDLKKHLVIDIPPNQTTEHEKPLNIALKLLPKQADLQATLSDGSPTNHTKFFDSPV